MLAELCTELATTLGFRQLTPGTSRAATKPCASCECRWVPRQGVAVALSSSQWRPSILARDHHLSSYPLRCAWHSARTLKNWLAT